MGAGLGHSVLAATLPVAFYMTDAQGWIRFYNEAEWIRRRGGHVIRIVRPDAKAVSAHVSEAGVSDWLVDAVVVNDGTLEDLHKAIRQMALDPNRQGRQIMSGQH